MQKWAKQEIDLKEKQQRYRKSHSYKLKKRTEEILKQHPLACKVSEHLSDPHSLIVCVQDELKNQKVERWKRKSYRVKFRELCNRKIFTDKHGRTTLLVPNGRLSVVIGDNKKLKYGRDEIKNIEEQLAGIVGMLEAASSQEI